MPQSLTQNYIHIIFSTKNREPFLLSPVKEEMHDYLGGICKRMDCFPVRVGGYIDHVHILCLLSKKITLIKLVEAVKSYSSKWIKTKGEEFQGFYWQQGYAAFSVSPSQLESLKVYIDKQEQHHQNRGFKEEYKAFLNKYEIEYHEKYVWD